MKLHLLFTFFVSILIMSCENDDINRDDNTCLIDKRVNVVYNSNLPSQADLINFTGTSLFIRDNVNFIEGIYIINNGTDFFTCLELAEPNDCLQVCDIPSRLTEGQFVYTCGDETRTYNLNGEIINGDEGDFNMRQYTARKSGNTLTITF